VYALPVLTFSDNDKWAQREAVIRGKKFRNAIITAMLTKQKETTVPGKEPQWELWKNAAEHTINVSSLFNLTADDSNGLGQSLPLSSPFLELQQ